MKRDWLVVNDQQVADTLTRPEKYAYLLPFMRAACTLTEAARELGIAPNKLFYQVKRLERLGLIYLVRTVKRAGRASKVYKASARRFIIPFQATSAETMVDTMRRMREPAELAITTRYLQVMGQTSDDVGLCLWLSDDGLLEMMYAPLHYEGWLDHEQLATEQFPAVFSKIASMPLTPAAAKEVQQDVIALYNKVKRLSRSGEKRYLMNFSIVPLED